MALYDDKWWLLSHISHSFVLSDDTGNSELVLTAKDAKFVREKVKKIAEAEGTEDFLDPLYLLEESDDYQPRSFEIRLGRNQLGYYHRPRCNTELKLEKLKLEKKNLSRVKSVNWRENPLPLTTDDLEELFPKKDLSQTKSSDQRKPSLLTYQLQNLPEIEPNPFEHFSKFDAASVSAKEKLRTLQIYFDITDSRERSYPLRIQVVASAKVLEVIGVICWRYTQEKRKPPLKPAIDSYALYMAEPDGSIEREFPPLDRKEPISKYGFPILGLVDRSSESEVNGSNGKDNDILIILPDGTFTIIHVETRDTPLSDLIEKAFSRRKILNTRFEHKYNIERKDTPGEALDKDSLLSGYDTNEFYIVRENSKRKEDTDLADKRLKHQISALEAPMYKEYQNVYIYTKVRTKVEVIIGISESKLEVYPKESSSKFWKRQKSVSYNMDGIVACDIVEKKANGKWVFRLVFHTDHGYKKNDFEGEEAVAGEIHSKLNHLLNWQPSEARDDYLAYKEKKKEMKALRK